MCYYFCNLVDLEKRKGATQVPKKLENIENRTFLNPPIVMAITENQATVCCRLVGGKVDYASFSGMTKHSMARQEICLCINDKWQHKT
jgi:hypothetical protein